MRLKGFTSALCSGRLKPKARFQLCAKCGHNLVDELAKNKSAVRHHTKGVQLQWEEHSSTSTVENVLQGKGESIKDKKGILQYVPNPKFLEEQ